jgi:hypothetical protein
MPNAKDKKKAAKKPVQKKFYTVEVECLIPAVVKYKVLVDEEDYQQAVAETVKIAPVERPSLHLGRMRRLKARVYDLGTNLLRHIQGF